MCGIVGYCGKKIQLKKIIDKLKKLEYRGYDSAGITSIKNNTITTIKQVGKIDNLLSNIPGNLHTTCAISHTRWATHGKATHTNAHPHSSSKEQWTIVHNGIIENYQELYDKLKTKPASDTDTAILSQYLEENCNDNIESFITAFKNIKGSYAIVCINKNNNDSLYIAKKNSPLYISQAYGEIWVASDPISLPLEYDYLYEMLDNEFAYISDSNISFYDNNINIVDKKHININESFEETNLNKYPHFMIKEIEEEQSAIEKQIQFYKDKCILKEYNYDFIKNYENIKLIGCGTAYHAGLVGARFIEKLVGIKCTVEIASEYIYKEPILDTNKTLFIFISQSGETADTLRALEIVKSKGFNYISLTNVLYSSIARKSKHILPTIAGPEIAVASTKAFVCQLTTLYMFASHIHNVLEGTFIDYEKDLREVAKKILSFNKEKLDIIAKSIYQSPTAIFLGKDIDYIVAMEASLKLKEVSYINSTSYPSGELKHGFLALVEDGTPLIIFATGSDIQISKTLNATQESIARGAKEIIITNRYEYSKHNDNSIYIDSLNPLLAPILSIAPMQYLAYKVSILKGINPDQPRNLAKSVTVE
ncbi:MAG: glutamine--fructose-6-phosphate transaminase (isomerizing) [Clostridiales bacterium]|nr:glutamine--fructose-6-phosphate transaminase (isomerizing) [Clostridiales bacterium]